MPIVDLPLAELERYKPDLTHEPDFDAFWRDTLDAARGLGGRPAVVRADTGVRAVDTYDVTFPGWAGEPVRGWLVVPKGRTARWCVVEFQGYGVGRGRAHEHLLYAACGIAHFVVDARGHSRGDTGDVSALSSGPHEPGFMTQGAHDPQAHYLRRLITDAVRAVDAARELVGAELLAAAGPSQGGGLALAASGLATGLDAVLPDVPFLCDHRRGALVSDRVPFLEVAQFLRKRPELAEQTFRTLSYFDGMNFAARASAPALFSVALMDPVCPPSTVYAAYHHYAGEKEIRVYPFNEHEGGGALHAMARVEFLCGLGDF
ncbi:acetylxylan esterase [Actinacidiphila bryophytorum]|uniref:acetylxylan esterase n=1 Tax=Actinacidiphila bryophytorum TaxID=1436133 RepID=UPI002176B78F|nr:acetylxylan esterase [Actinacidiphila bryophytorum]UWE11109.1 acetylxylan esterase [Actinacidiphila bryophytorum]